MSDKSEKPVTGKPSPQIEERAVDFEGIRAVAKHAQLVGIELLDLTARGLSPEEVKSWPPKMFDESISHRARQVEAGGPQLSSLVEFKYQSNPPGVRPIHVSGAFYVVYQIAAKDGIDLSGEALDQFAEVNGAYNAWPFIRELVSSCAMRLGREGVTLPLLVVPAKLPPAGSWISNQRRKSMDTQVQPTVKRRKK